MKYLKVLQKDLIIAMKAKDKIKIRTIRSVLAKLKEKKIEQNEDLNEQQEMVVIKKAFKTRKESQITYSNANREDLAIIEKEEMDIIQHYLPEELDEAKIITIVKDVIKETGAETMRDMGKVMKSVMKKVAGQADGKIIQTIVKKELGN